DESGLQDMNDPQTYVSLILNNDISPTTCNDLNADEDISVYDAALLSSCLNYGRNHPHVGQGLHDHCTFPSGADNTLDTVALSIIAANFDEQYIDIGIRNPSSYVTAYQFKMSGITIQQVENLVNPAVYPIIPRNNISEGMVIGISYQDSAVDKSNVVQPLCRIRYSGIEPGLVCIDRIIDIVDRAPHRVANRIEDGCVEYTVSSVNGPVANNMAVSVQPNPFDQSTLLRFANPEGGAYRLELMDAHGRLVRRYTDISGGEHRIERGDLSSGLYFFRLY
ncbi:MAG TPA: T9SS type A sorting domain-containing protein, partial [Saprospiraceae bacterium]|nr:T9SS type A sorting domain-containing protein [Saprospiraceae bacterium]